MSQTDVHLAACVGEHEHDLAAEISLDWIYRGRPDWLRYQLVEDMKSLRKSA
jgi:hypothetical protein